jgi:hypothetical protein
MYGSSVIFSPASLGVSIKSASIITLKIIAIYQPLSLLLLRVKLKFERVALIVRLFELSPQSRYLGFP